MRYIISTKKEDSVYELDAHKVSAGNATSIRGHGWWWEGPASLRKRRRVYTVPSCGLDESFHRTTSVSLQNR